MLDAMRWLACKGSLTFFILLPFFFPGPFFSQQVGVDVCAKIEVTSVEEIRKDGEAVSTSEHDFGSRQDGYCVLLKTSVVRVQDDAVIADGTHSVWVPRYASR